VKLLQKSPPDEAALTELKGLTDAELERLDAKAATMRSKAAATLLHRAAAFGRFWKKHAELKPKAGATFTDPGTLVKAANASLKSGDVEVLVGATGPGEGYTLRYTIKQGKGASIANAQWLQFAWREVISERPARGGGAPSRSPLEQRLGRPLGSDSLFYFWLTTDPKDPNWNTDTSTKSSPFFEEGTGTVKRTNETLELFDPPSPGQAEVKQAFGNAADPPARVVSHFHATTYLVQGMNVTYRADIDLSWPFEKADVVPKMDAKAVGGPAAEIAPEHRARLLKQFPDLDYLAGKPIPAPRMRPRFGPIAGPLDEKAWKAKKARREQFADVAKIAGADKIESVWELSAAAINTVDKVDDGAPGAPGLNFATSLSEDGTARFVDRGMFQGRLPVTAEGPLPRVAIILGPGAFARDEAFALMSLRHEMEHARHLELATEWLLKWRTERSGKPFWTWIESQNIPKNIYALIEYAKVGGPRASTELLAHIEGLVATFQFVPADPDISLMKSGDYPAAIASLKELGMKGYVGGAPSVRGDAVSRVREFCCKDQVRGKALLKWIDALLDPSLFKPRQGDEQTVKLIKNDFGTGETSTSGQRDLKGFLQEIRAEIKKPCPK